VAGSLLAESQLPRREVVLISDFQRSGWRGQEGTSLPAGATLSAVPVQGTANRPNLSVTAVSLQRSRFANQERVTVTAGITNRSETAVTNQPVTLEAGGLQVAAKTFSVDAGASTSVSFDPFTIAGRNYKGTVRLGEDALIADNSFNFVVSPSEPVHVILVDRGGGGSGLYVAQALTIGDSPKFDLVTRQPENLTDEDLRKTSLVVLNDVAVASPLGRRLLKFVEGAAGCSWRPVRARRGHATSICCRRRSATPWTARAATRHAWAPSSSATRCSKRSGPPGAATSPRCGCTAIAIWGRPPAPRCWRGSTPALRRWSSAASAPGACC
jgi:hypothetical protein